MREQDRAGGVEAWWASRWSGFPHRQVRQKIPDTTIIMITTTRSRNPQRHSPRGQLDRKKWARSRFSRAADRRVSRACPGGIVCCGACRWVNCSY